MRFEEMEYARPDIEAVRQQFEDAIRRFNGAQSAREELDIIDSLNVTRTEVESAFNLAGIRFSMNTEDEMYREEMAYLEKASPVYEGLLADWDKALTGSSFRAELEQTLGKTRFRKAENRVAGFDPALLEDMARINELSSEYQKLVGGARILYQGEERTLDQMSAFEGVLDRLARRSAVDAKWGFYAEHEAEFDAIFDELVRVRTAMARKLGYENFVPVGYIRMNRDYSSEQVADFRKQIRDFAVPLLVELKNRQCERLNLDRLTHTDEPLIFPEGNPAVRGDANFIVEQSSIMFDELSPETSRFFQFMKENGLMDLISRPGKSPSGFCSVIPKYQSPFIFSNFNGTSEDLFVLRHEAGHAFQMYRTMRSSIRDGELLIPTFDAAEIHSVSMEFFTWPWLERFFGDEAEKYRYQHLAMTLQLIVLQTMYDEFHHVVYSNPDWTPLERKHAWRDIERTYMPYLDYDGNAFLEGGMSFIWRGPILMYPFYAIDYTLARMCALQFWIRTRANDEKAWVDYLRLCDLGGTKSFAELVADAHLQSPFDAGCVASIIKEMSRWFDSHVM